MKADSKTHVLMIDDDENDAMLVRHMVSKMPDAPCHVHWAGSYDQGLKAISEIDWDLCLVDYQLGGHTGVQFVTESRARGAQCPFLLITGAGSRAIDLQAMRAGVKGYLEKNRLCPLELERAIRYAIGSDPVHQQAATAEPSRVPAEAAELIRKIYAAGQPFVVVGLMLDRESILRNHLSSRYLERIAKELESLIRQRISTTEALFLTQDGGFLLVSSALDTRAARQFLSMLLSEPLALSADDRSRSVSLPAILRRNVFASSGYPGPVPVFADLDAFLAS